MEKGWLKNLIKELQDVIKEDVVLLEKAVNKVAAIKCYLGDLQVFNDVMRWSENSDFTSMDSEAFYTSEYRWEIWKRVECNRRPVRTIQN